MSQGKKNQKFPSLSKAVKDAYMNGEEDERLEPIIVIDHDGSPRGRFRNGDWVIFYDVRGEREIELTRAFVDENFDAFPVEKLNLNFVTMIEYDKDLKVKVAFPPQRKITGTLCHVLSNNKLRYIKIVESEKVFHLTYFFNGKSSELLPGEERLIIPSIKVSKVEEKPEMRIEDVTKAITTKLKENMIPIIIANLANVDVIGHTENEAAIMKAVEAVDSSLGKIIKEARKKVITTIVTADHGTVEKWLYPDGTIDTGHTTSQVPFILVEPDKEISRKIKLRKKGELTDIAPTILDILDIEKPKIMTGKTLLSQNPYKEKQRRRLLFLILDGWGINDETKGNLIKKANTPKMDHLIKRFPNTRLSAAGEAVGMPKGSVGNSEVGHLHMGAGRRILSDRLRIANAIKDKSFFENPVLFNVMRTTKSSDKNLHLLGIVSFYSSHGSIEHLKALLKMAKSEGLENVYIHSILGRRGEKKESGARYIDEIEKFTKKLNLGKVVTVIGRHWVLDREENWDRIEKSYKSLVYGEGKKVLIE
jgi:2,3-bisphosphoglycerate-independent phosphoglycerate mutase